MANALSTIHFETLGIDRPLPNLALALVKHHNDVIVAGQPRTRDSSISLVLLETERGWRIRQFNNKLVQD